MRENEQYVLDLFNSGEEVYIPDLASKLIDNKQEKLVKQRSVEHAKDRHVMNYVRSVLRRFGIRVRSTKKLTLKKLTTERDYQLLRQSKYAQKYRLEDEILEIDSTMEKLGFNIQQKMDIEGGEMIVKNTQQDTVETTPRASSKPKEAVNG